jgi:hypothetical protein
MQDDNLCGIGGILGARGSDGCCGALGAGGDIDLTTTDLCDCLQLLPFYSSMMTTTTVTTLTALGDDRQKFPTSHLEDELVFKWGRDVIG